MTFKQTFITYYLGLELVLLLVALVWIQPRLKQFHIPSSIKVTKCFKITGQSWPGVRRKAVHSHGPLKTSSTLGS